MNFKNILEIFFKMILKNIIFNVYIFLKYTVLYIL